MNGYSSNGIVYLAGPIAGLHYDEAVDWRRKVTQELFNKGIMCLSPMRNKEFLEGQVIDRDTNFQDQFPLGRPEGLTARDRFDVMRSDLILMNMMDSEDRISIGSCIEIGWADAFHKPIILACKQGGYFDKHPMVKSIVGFKVYHLDSAIKTVKDILLR